jgi:hypothetical protein
MSQIPSSAERSANIFINYRREDSAGHTGRLFDRLSARLPGRVFMDIDTLEPGVDFVEVIEKAVGSCEVLIVVMGQEWLRVKDAAGHRRLDDPADYVRLELATALQRKIRVIPVLVQGAPMPRAEDLPADLAKLARRNAIELSDARWAYDVDRLIRTIEEVLRGLELRAPAAAAAPAAESHVAAPTAAAVTAATAATATAATATAASAARPRAWMAALAAVVVCGLASAGWKVMTQQAGRSVVVPAPTAPTPGHRAPATLAPAAAVAAAPVPSAPAAAVPAPVARAAAAQISTAQAPTSIATAPAPAAPVRAAPVRATPVPAAPAAAVPAPAARAAAAQAPSAQASTSTATALAPAVRAPAAPVPAAPVPAAPPAAVPAPAAPPTAVPGDRARPNAEPTAAVPDAAIAAPGGQAKSARAYETLGMKSLQEGRYNEAVTALTSAINLSRTLGKDALDALYARSIAYSRSGRASDAISDLESLLKARDDPHYREELAIAYALAGKREAAIEQYRLLLQPHPDDAWFNLQVGILYIQTHDYRKAVPAYQKALANRKQLTETLVADAYENLGIAYFYLCWREEAIAAFKKAAELNPGFATSLANAQRLMCQRL